MIDPTADRTDLDTLQTEAKAIIADMEVMQGKIDTEKDETRLKIYKQEWTKKSAEFEILKGKVEKIQERIRDKETAMREEVLKDIEQLSESKVHGKDLRNFEGARNEDKDARIHMQAVADYMKGKKLAEYAPKLRQKFGGKVNGEVAIKLPQQAVDLILGPVFGRKLSAAKGLMEALEGKASCSGTGDYSTMPYASQNAYMTAATSWTEYKKTLLDLPGEPADILSRLTMVPAESGTAHWVRTVDTDAAEYAGVVATWLPCEGDNKIATQVKFEDFDISTYELCAYTEITDRALKRSMVPIETILATNFRDAVKHAIEYAVLRGTGAGQPDGVIDVAGIHQVHRKCNNDVQCEDFIELKYALLRHHRPGSLFVLQDDAAKEMDKDRFGGTDCECVAYCWTEDRAAGYPWMSTHRLPATGTDGDVLFGNFSHYILAVEQDVLLARSDVAGEMFRRNSTAFKVYTIVGGEVSQPRAFAQLVGCAGGSCCCAT